NSLAIHDAACYPLSLMPPRRTRPRTPAPRRAGEATVLQRRTDPMATPKSSSETQAETASELFTQIQTKALDAFAAFAEANQRVLEGFVDLSVSTAKESMRAYAELQSAAVETARAHQPAAPAPIFPTAEELRSDPFTWYQKGLLTTIDGTQKVFRLLEANAQVVTRSAERLQASTERTSKEIQEALTSYVSKMKDIDARN